jgi:dTDP-4-dehydrorhamnose 3,5-epimerase
MLETAGKKSMTDAARDSVSSAMGSRDVKTAGPGGHRAQPMQIAGVKLFELGNILTRSGWMLELFRTDWPVVDVSPQQVNYVQLNPNGVTDWHCHDRQVDHIIGVGGAIKLALWDTRDGSLTKGKVDIIRIGAIRPVMVVVPPGVWHALRNECGQPAGYLNVTDQLYCYDDPDNRRLTPGMVEVPSVL